MFDKGYYLEQFNKMGWPSLKDENWKYTQLKELQAITWQEHQTSSQQFTSYLDGLAFLKHYFVFIDGILNLNLSKVPTVSAVNVFSVRSLLNENDLTISEEIKNFNNKRALNYLNTAMLSDGAVIKVKSELKEPLGLIFITTQKQIQNHIRNVIHVAPQARAKIIKFYKGFDQSYFNNVLTTVKVEQQGSLELYKIQEESARAYHISCTEVELNKESHFESHLQGFGAHLSRNEIYVHMKEPYCTAKLFGLYAADNKQHVDNFTYIDHAVESCQSEELYKGILDGHSHGVFSGQVLVREDAQKTDAKQTNKNLLLSEDAQIYTKPQLMIYADDVKCAHGATIGQLDKASVFYLRSRGIDEVQAKHILTKAFAVEMIEKINDQKIHDHFDKTLQNWFNHQTLH